jgi:uncharacterized membrane protein YqjE
MMADIAFTVAFYAVVIAALVGLWKLATWLEDDVLSGWMTKREWESADRSALEAIERKGQQ